MAAFWAEVDPVGKQVQSLMACQALSQHCNGQSMVVCWRFQFDHAAQEQGLSWQPIHEYWQDRVLISHQHWLKPAMSMASSTFGRFVFGVQKAKRFVHQICRGAFCHWHSLFDVKCEMVERSFVNWQSKWPESVLRSPHWLVKPSHIPLISKAGTPTCCVDINDHSIDLE